MLASGIFQVKLIENAAVSLRVSYESKRQQTLALSEPRDLVKLMTQSSSDDETPGSPHKLLKTLSYS